MGRYRRTADRFLTLMQELCPQYGIPWQVAFVQCAHESGGGTSLLGREAHNFFGLKYRRGVVKKLAKLGYEPGPHHELAEGEAPPPPWSFRKVTTEIIEVKSEAQLARLHKCGWRFYNAKVGERAEGRKGLLFLSMPDDRVGVLAYCLFMSRKWYADAAALAHDPARWILMVWALGYATSTSYVTRVWSKLRRCAEALGDKRFRPQVTDELEVLLEELKAAPMRRSDDDGETRRRLARKALRENGLTALPASEYEVVTFEPMEIYIRARAKP